MLNRIMHVTATRDGFVHAYITDAGETMCGMNPQGGTTREVDCDACILQMRHLEAVAANALAELEKIK